MSKEVGGTQAEHPGRRAYNKESTPRPNEESCEHREPRLKTFALPWTTSAFVCSRVCFHDMFAKRTKELASERKPCSLPASGVIDAGVLPCLCFGVRSLR